MLSLNGFQFWCHFKSDTVYIGLFYCRFYLHYAEKNSLADAIALGTKNGSPEIQLLSR